MTETRLSDTRSTKVDLSAQYNIFSRLNLNQQPWWR